MLFKISLVFLLLQLAIANNSSQSIKTTTKKIQNSTKLNESNLTVLSIPSNELVKAVGHFNQLVAFLNKFVFEKSLVQSVVSTTTTSKPASLKTSSNFTVPRNMTICVGKFTTKKVGNVTQIVCSKDSNGKSRPAYEVDCQFPFYYNGTWHDKCVFNSTGSKWWCSLDNLFNKTYLYAQCEMECPLLARNIASLNHTACAEAHPRLEESILPSEDDIKEIVDYHNRIRAELAHEAVDLRELTWDQSLAQMALRKAETCNHEHDCNSCRRLLNNRSISVGQNGFSAWGTLQPPELWTYAVDGWYAEKEDFKYGGGHTPGKLIGHYTQIVSSMTSRVGCAAAKCNSQVYVFCNYAGAQISYDVPYTRREVQNSTVSLNETTKATNTTSSRKVLTKRCGDCPDKLCTKSGLCACHKICQYGGKLDLKTCKCSCPAFTAGLECERLVCDKSDKEYGCWTEKASDCTYANIPPICPRLCQICQPT